jgi:hypothetical protein
MTSPILDTGRHEALTSDSHWLTSVRHWSVSTKLS